MAYLITIVLYSVAQIALGVWVARHVKGSSDFFVAGRTLGPGLLFATFATLIFVPTMYKLLRRQPAAVTDSSIKGGADAIA